MRCAIYARYSSELQDKRSAEDQIRNCRQFANQRGWTVIDGYIFSDQAISGASQIGRTGLANLLKAAESITRPFDYVLIDDTSRLSREQGGVDKIVKQLRYYNVHVYFVTQNIDSKKSESEIIYGVHGVFDSQLRQDLAEKTLRGLKGQVSRGYNAGGCVYGYQRKDIIDQNQIDRKTGQFKRIGVKHEIDNERTGTVREIFTLFDSGISTREIAHHLNKKGVPPPANKRQLKNGSDKPAWIPNTVKGLLTNPKYIGDWTFNKTGWIKNPKTGQRKRVLKPSSEWEISKRPDLAIIDNDLWGRVQKRIETRKTGPHKKKRSSEPKYLFSGLMKCHVCGSNYALISGSDRPNPRFGCSRNWCRGAAACSNYFKVSQDEIESVILSDIQNDLLSPPILSAIINKANKYLKAKLDKLKRESGDIVKRRLQLQKNLSNILDAIGQAGMTPGLHRRLTDIESQIRELDTNQETLNRAYDFENLKIDEEYVSSWLGRLKDLLNTDLTSARAELGSLIGEFTLSPEMIEGVKYLRVKANANIGGLLRIATGRHSNKKLNTQPPVFKQLKSAIILNPALLGSGFI